MSAPQEEADNCASVTEAERARTAAAARAWQEELGEVLRRGGDREAWPECVRRVVEERERISARAAERELRKDIEHMEGCAARPPRPRGCFPSALPGEGKVRAPVESAAERPPNNGSTEPMLRSSSVSGIPEPNDALHGAVACRLSSGRGQHRQPYVCVCVCVGGCGG